MKKHVSGKRTTGALALCLLIVVACAPADTAYRNLYDGLQKREQLLNPSGGTMANELPAYDTYNRERDQALNKEARRRSLP